LLVNRRLSLYSSIVRPILFRLPAESAHEFALRSLRLGLLLPAARKSVARRFQTEPFGSLERFGLQFHNPVGLAAGFDKNGTAATDLAALGFGFIEVGTVTNEPQPGNPKPRVFRLPRDHALVNRLGFNNCGAKQLAENIRRNRPACVLGINIGKSRRVAIEEAIPDYLASFEAIYQVADYVAINVSSPNTPNLRDLQQPGMLENLIASLQTLNSELSSLNSTAPHPKPLLLKIAPDLTDAEVELIIDVAMRTNISGIIATNTTTEREGLETPAKDVQSYGEGGLSGAPLRQRSNQIISLIFRITGGRVPIIGVGGVFSAVDAWEKVRAGASLIQLYTGFIYEGPGVVKRINEDLAVIIKREGFASLDAAVGSGATK
jgi:dihydroorotate dehydrogenase